MTERSCVDCGATEQTAVLRLATDGHGWLDLCDTCAPPTAGADQPSAPARPPVRRYVCGAGTGPCGAPDARLFMCGWRCPRHLPGAPVVRDLTVLDWGGPLVLRMEAT